MNIQKNVSLSDFTTLGTGGPSAFFVSAKSADDVVEILNTQQAPFWTLGRGANSLISDEGLPGTTIHMLLNETSYQDSELVVVEAGRNWDEFVSEVVERGLWGLEHTSGIPSSVAGAVVGNIAAYGQAVSDSLVWIEVIDHNSESRIAKRIPASELGLGYRTSNFAKPSSSSSIILRAAFKLSNEPTSELYYESALSANNKGQFDINTLSGRRALVLRAREIAGSLLDKQHPQKTAGSFFKNPMVSSEQAEKLIKHEEKAVTKEAIIRQNKIHGGHESRVSAAHVLLAAGYKRGQTWGPVRLHPEHILKIENTGGATSQQIHTVAHEIIETVERKLNITLESEVKFIGEFA